MDDPYDYKYNSNPEDEFADFDKEYPDFKWRETPMYKHPKGRKCQCPKHEHLREKFKTNKMAQKNSKEMVSTVFKLCPEHYDVFWEEFEKLSFIRRMLNKLLLRWRFVVIERITAMNSKQCFYCRFGSGKKEDKRTVFPTL